MGTQTVRQVPIVFRKAISEIPTTTYGTFGIYRYPAKFIPQVVAYAIKRYGKPGAKVFDPFAGCGTVGVVSRLCGYDYEIWDLNPMIKVLHDTATMRSAKVNVGDMIDEVKNSQKEFIPKWSNLGYWFHEDFIPTLAKAWGFAHSLMAEAKYALLIPLLKVTRYFSYGDETQHKNSSRYAREKIKHLVENDWQTIFYEMLETEMRKLLRKVEEYNRLGPSDVQHRIRAGIDVLEARLGDEVDILITSPPYLQAQEYIRSTKMELFWLGYEESYIRRLSKSEIPYRPVEKIKINSNKYWWFRDKIKEAYLKTLYDNYFHAILNAFAVLGERVKDCMCIFVGRAKIRSIPIPIDEIIVEHLRDIGWKHEVTLTDKIVARVMFRSGINPASGAKDSRIEAEHLVILKRKPA